MEYKYKFTVIIPIYNVEKYLEETINSVVNQTIGFKDNIQMVLVNDGSPDNSEKICLKYKEMYPNNVVYVKQENAGVSAARNNGMNYIEGKYVNFLDSDDKWDLDVFEKAYEMFESHKSIDVIGVRQKFFEARDDYSYLDYKFKDDTIIDIFEEYDCIQLSVTSGFIRAAALVGKQFDTRIKYSEDAKLLYEVILEKEHYGIISSSNHNYRKRYGGDSAIQKSHTDLSWYFDTTELSYKYVFDLSKKKYGYVIPFCQYYVMYDLQWRLIKESIHVLNDEQEKRYLEIIKELLQDIDDEIIMKQRRLFRERIVYFWSLKHGYDVRKDFKYDKCKIKYKNMIINDIQLNRFITINIIDVRNNEIYLEGKLLDYYPEEDYIIYVKTDNKKKYKLEYFDMPFNNQTAIDGNVFFKGIGFKVHFPLGGVNSFRIMIDYQKIHTRRLHFKCENLSGLNETIDNHYLVKGKYIISTANHVISIEKNKKGLIHEKEKLYIKELRHRKEFYVIFIRYLYRLLRKFKKKPIWLVSDRTTAANDNGMHLFKYINKVDKDIDCYFVISKKSKDYNEMKKIGKVLDCDSLKYKLYFLLSDKIISSQANDIEMNAFGENSQYLRDLYKFKFVFLQHGITKDDLSKWLHKQNKNLSMFVTAAKAEYDSIVNGNYDYGKDVVKLTGFPRYDNLVDKSKKMIAIMPTWRSNLAGLTNVVTGEHEYSKAFKSTEYFNFYNDLINDERIIKKMKSKGYSGIFVVHPSHMENYIDFKENDTFKVVEGFADYQKIFSESNLLLTDFSSVAFDFAYLNKPVIYTQFDKKTFFEGQVYDKGYYDYEDDGFGPVLYNYDSTVNEIIKYIDNDCKLDKKYKERIDKFYLYHDKNNCKRVYEEIKKL